MLKCSPSAQPSPFPICAHLQRLIASAGLWAPLWPAGEVVELLDQRRLPFEQVLVRVESAGAMAAAVRVMAIRGSGALGCAGAFGAYLAVRSAPADPPEWGAPLAELGAARPTAKPLQLGMREVMQAAYQAADPMVAAAEAAAGFMLRQIEIERALGQHGQALIPDGATLLTHCHSGALAGAGYGGRALSPIRAAVEAGRQVRVIAQETRPYLQGARLTAWELQQLGVRVTLVTDGMSGALMQHGDIDLCLVGSDRVAANGDLANKVGTYLIALAARAQAIPFYTATTRYTVDPDCPTGREIPIEFRPAQEVLEYNGQPIAPTGVDALYPAFDITPADLLSGIITEAGVFAPPFAPALRRLTQAER